MSTDDPIQLEPVDEPQRSRVEPAVAPAVEAPTGRAIAVREAVRTYRPGALSRLGRRRGASVPRGTRVALDRVSIEVPRRTWLGLLGPNGSGKSTLLRLMATLDRPDHGSIEVLGASLSAGTASVRRQLGVVFQRPGLDPVLTVRENLMLQGRLFGLGSDDTEGRIAVLAADLGIGDRLTERVARLSGGLARRADLARALLTNPTLLLLDEPTAGLDLDARLGFMRLLAAQRRRGDLTIVMTTHQMDEAEAADQVALMDEGRIVAVGAPADLRRAMGDRVVRAGQDHAELLAAAGMRVEKIGDGAAVGAGDDDAVERAVVALARAGAAFDVGPPTLGDVYLERTGRRLSADSTTTPGEAA